MPGIGFPVRVKRSLCAARPSWLYRLALGVVAVTMACLPMIYVGVVAASVYALYLYVTQYAFIAWASSGGSGIFSVVLTGTPLLVGWVAIIGLARPVFARRAEATQRITLEPDKVPALHHLVLEVCRELQVSMPRRIEFSCDLNASAGFDCGWRGWISGRLILTLGMPLIAGLTQRELAGVIAHELGHFRQRAGMRASFVIRAINHWFARVVFVPSLWDPEIGEGSPSLRSYPFWMSALVVCAQVGSFLARGVLWLLMICGHVIGAALMRQMEFDADRCEVLVAGSRAFESTAAKFAELGPALHEAHYVIARIWGTRRRLPNDMATLVERYADKQRVERSAEATVQAKAARTGWLDTHPNMAARVGRARRMAESGGDLSDAPATGLFGKFEEWSQRVTWAYFGDEHNLPVSRKVVLTVDEWMLAAVPAPVKAQELPPPLPA